VPKSGSPKTRCSVLPTSIPACTRLRRYLKLDLKHGETGTRAVTKTRTVTSVVSSTLRQPTEQRVLCLESLSIINRLLTRPTWIVSKTFRLLGFPRSLRLLLMVTDAVICARSRRWSSISTETGARMTATRVLRYVWSYIDSFQLPLILGTTTDTFIHSTRGSLKPRSTKRTIPRTTRAPPRNWKPFWPR
jgi:hypothetical protein